MALDPKAKLAKFENKLYEIKEDWGTLKLIPVSDDDVADAVVLNVDLESMRNISFEAMLEDTKANVLKEASQNMKKIVWSALGFETKWSDWEIKTGSVMDGLIGQPLKEFIIANQLAPETFIGNPEEQRKIREAIQANIRNQVKRCIDSHTVSRLIETMLKEEMNKVVQQHVKNNLVDMLIKKAGGTVVEKEKILSAEKQDDGTIVLKTTLTKNEYIDKDDDEDIPF
jgi:hypothetical protein